MLAEYINANTLLKKEIIQLKKANINPEHHLKSEKVKEEQLDPASIKEEPIDKGLKQFLWTMYKLTKVNMLFVDNQSPSSPLKHIKQETKADPQTTKGEYGISSI